MKTVDITVSGDSGRAKTVVEQVLFGRGFAVTWTDSWTGSAEKGSKRGFGFYYKVGLSIMSGAPGQFTLRVQPLISRMQNGLAFVGRTNRFFSDLNAELATALAEMGTVVSSVEV
jgi:hypothetical protein